ncbi:MAG: hypothetical protein Q9187_006604, partial [Circinaria calcarea]
KNRCSFQDARRRCIDHRRLRNHTHTHADEEIHDCAGEEVQVPVLQSSVQQE